MLEKDISRSGATFQADRVEKYLLMEVSAADVLAYL